MYTRYAVRLYTTIPFQFITNELLAGRPIMYVHIRLLADCPFCDVACLSVSELQRTVITSSFMLRRTGRHSTTSRNLLRENLQISVHPLLFLTASPPQSPNQPPDN